MDTVNTAFSLRTIGRSIGVPSTEDLNNGTMRSFSQNGKKTRPVSDDSASNLDRTVDRANKH